MREKKGSLRRISFAIIKPYEMKGWFEMWEPKTFEDHLLKHYLEENSGKLFLGISVSFILNFIKQEG